ncbi:Protein ral2 like protein [Verticillium longisporum]
MSSPGLTPNQFSPAQADQSKALDSDTDQERDRPPAPAKSPSELLSGVYRGFKKFAPSRDDSLRRQPSSLGLRSTTPTSSASSPSPTTDARSPPPPPIVQHARSLSLQSSLAKPLPEPPPEQSEADSFPAPAAAPSIANNLDAIPEDLPVMADSRTSTMDSNVSVDQAQAYVGAQGGYNTDMSASQTSLASSSRQDAREERRDNLTPKSTGPASAGPSPSVTQTRGPAVATSASSSSAHLSGLMCNVHRTTGKEPHPLVGATTTILGDKLYVFGGRILSRSRPAPLTADLYELDLIRRHWTRLETTGDIPPPRYFHSMCPLGDTKMVCYGGMSPTTNQAGAAPDQQPEVTVMSDIYIYDVPSRKWTYIPTQDPPQGRYAHCACILPSSASFSSHKAPLSALQHNPPSANPNEGRIGINIDGSGGAEMIIVGGQDGANHYIEQVSVFNLRSLKWTSTQSLGKSCGAYRSVVAPLPPSVTSKIGKAGVNGSQREGGISQEAREPGSSMLIYSNYNFLDVKLELQIRSSDGSLSEKPMSGAYSPPGLRFPNGGVIDTHFVVSGTYLTSSKQEYALWALDLRTLTWSRIDAGGSVFSQGSWNRGVLWNRRNTFVVLGNRKRSLVDDYNHRRINFSNVCMVELEAFGFYDNPRKTAPLSGFVSSSSPFTGPDLSLARKAGCTAGGRFHSRASEELGEKALALRELSDMDILCLHGERIPVNSRIVARRWGPYFVQLLREGAATQDGSDAMTLRGGLSNTVRNSGVTITPSRDRVESITSMGSTIASSFGSSGKQPSTAQSSIAGSAFLPQTGLDTNNPNAAPTPISLPPRSRPRCLYLPHTYLTLQALLHFLYTSSLPAPSSPLCTPPILCSLLQIARPYRIDGLLEAVVERLHVLLDSRNAAAVFNATAMAAGGGRGIDGSLNPNFFVPPVDLIASLESAPASEASRDSDNNSEARNAALRLNTTVQQQSSRPRSGELSATTSQSDSEWSSEIGESEGGGVREIWSGELSSVIGLQKRGLRGLMEGRRMRERTGTGTGSVSQYGPQSRVGLGIASS